MSQQDSASSHDVADFLEQNGIRTPDQFLELVHRVAAIPWGEARTVEDVIRMNMGTCTGKHLLLQECLRMIGIPVRSVVCTFRWEHQGLQLPATLRESLTLCSWKHGHNFVQVRNGDTWIDLDVTWDAPLVSYGFRALPAEWDGTTSFVGLSSIERRWEDIDIADMKEQLMAALTPQQKAAREEFLHAFIQWIASLR